MSLLDLIGSADGQPSANYIRGGRTLLRITSCVLREKTAKLPRDAFRIDGDILKSTNPLHQGQVGLVTGTMNLGFKFANDDLAKMRRALAAAASSKGIGREANGLCRETEAAERAKEFVGEKQPLVGAIVTVVADERPQARDPSKTFTHYEVVVPNEKDLEGVNL